MGSEAVHPRYSLRGSDDDAGTEVDGVPRDAVDIIDTDNLEALDGASGLAVGFISEVRVVLALPGGLTALDEVQATEVNVALVAGAPGVGVLGGGLEAGVEVDLLAARESVIGVKGEGELALLAGGLGRVGECEECGEVLGLLDLANDGALDGSGTDVVLPEGGGLEGDLSAGLKRLGSGSAEDRGRGEEGGEDGLCREEHCE